MYKNMKKNCHFTWTSYNEVNGIMATSPNGNKIFLRAAGIRVNSDEFRFLGERC